MPENLGPRESSSFAWKNLIIITPVTLMEIAVKDSKAMDIVLEDATQNSECVSSISRTKLTTIRSVPSARRSPPSWDPTTLQSTDHPLNLISTSNGRERSVWSSKLTMRTTLESLYPVIIRRSFTGSQNHRVLTPDQIGFMAKIPSFSMITD